MDLFNVLTYLNKLSLAAFFITAVVLIYQVVIIKRDSNKKNSTPTIPNFNENMAIPVKNFTSINEEKLIHKTQPMPKNIFFPIIGVTVICLILVFYLITRQNKQADIVVTDTNKIVPTTAVVKRSISPTSASAAIPTRIPTAYNNKETVIAYITPTGQLAEKTPASSSTNSPTKAATLPLTGTIENGLIIAVISGFMIILAFVF